MSTPSNHLPAKTRRQWLQFFARHKEIKKVVLFGSRARGDAARSADIDLSISAPRASQRQWLDIAHFIKEESNTLIPIDVVRWEEAPLALRKSIKKYGVHLYGRSQD